MYVAQCHISISRIVINIQLLPLAYTDTTYTLIQKSHWYGGTVFVNKGSHQKRHFLG